ncbi:helix-turn-helix transcriptional regulator [Paractinoplanes brasiliensis]|uniref:helix-turn-helix transcriptional regulator n=1 Tax=Paractinoplanes brasiliensis TaxID=52695 RepID=UPI0010617862|nr:LuxR C-terminal-related transcriptional regulator [Actinoplanes brasiliensis]
MTATESETDVSTRAQVARTLFEWSNLCIASLDAKQHIVDTSAEFLRRFGGTQRSRAGQDFNELLHPGTRDKVRRKIQRVIAENRTTFDDSIVGLGPRDSVFSGGMNGFVARGAGSQVDGIVVMVTPDKLGDGGNPAPGVSARHQVLTEIDARILEGVAAGASTVQLASRLHLSRQGVEYRIGSMFRKLNVPNRAALVSRAYAIGALTVGTWPPRIKEDFVRR